MIAAIKRVALTTDPLRAAGIICGFTITTIRLWTILAMPDNPIYTYYPVWAQFGVAAAFAMQGMIAVFDEPKELQRVAAGICFAAAFVGLVMTLAGSWRAGGWVLNADFAMIELWLYWRLGRITRTQTT